MNSTNAAKYHARRREGVEWFMPGTVPKERCTWHDRGRIVLPQLYAQWLDQARALGAKAVAIEGEGCCLKDSVPVLSLSGGAPSAADEPTHASQGLESSTGFRILSPLEGDRYAVPPSVDAHYATIALRASGASGTVRWTVDERPVSSARLRLVRGVHEVRAQSGGESRVVHFTVD